MNTEIRYLSPEDYRTFRQIRLEALETDPDAFGALHVDACRRTDAEWKNWVANVIVPGRKNVVVEEEGGSPVGMCGFGLSDEDPETGFLWGMFVSRNHRRKQCGERLLKEAEDWLSANRAKKITACVAAPNESAIRFYRKNGYMIGPVSGTLRPGSSIPIHPIEKRLNGLRQVSPDNPADWSAYHAIRKAVLWDGRGRSSYQTNHPDETAEGNYPMLFVVSGKPVGVVRIDLKKDKRQAIFRRVAIAVAEQKKGFGTALMRAAEEFARQRGCEIFVANVAPDAVPFYARLGYMPDAQSAENDPRNPRMVKDGGVREFSRRSG